MGKVLFVVAFLFAATTITKAQVSYGNGSSRMKIDVETVNDTTFLHVIFTSKSLHVADKPKMLLKLSDKTIMDFNGILISVEKTEDGSYTNGNHYFGYTTTPTYIYISDMKFPITKEQISDLCKGVIKLRLNTIPEYYNKPWHIDAVGIPIYKKYMNIGQHAGEDKFKDDF